MTPSTVAPPEKLRPEALPDGRLILSAGARRGRRTHFPDESNPEECRSTHCFCSRVSGTGQPLDSSIERNADSVESPICISAEATIIDERPIPARQ